MRELTISETEHAAGGIGPIGAIALGVAAAYAYEKLGGAKGIERKVKAAVNALIEGGKVHANLCSEKPAACIMPIG